jgi:dUTP pyrophosphatase
MSYRMIYTLRRLMCDKFSVLCTMAELNAKQLKEEYTMKLNVKIKRLNEDAVIPKYAREGDAGFDLIATEDVIIEPGETKLVPTGLAFELPPGYEMTIRPRSGVTLKTKLRVQLGTVDSGYRGEVGVIVDNIAQKTGINVNYAMSIDGIGANFKHFPNGNGSEVYTYIIRKGDRIAQAVIAPFETAHFVDSDKLEESMRGGQGFGSSGVK